MKNSLTQRWQTVRTGLALGALAIGCIGVASCGGENPFPPGGTSGQGGSSGASPNGGNTAQGGEAGLIGGGRGGGGGQPGAGRSGSGGSSGTTSEGGNGDVMNGGEGGAIEEAGASGAGEGATGAVAAVGGTGGQTGGGSGGAALAGGGGLGGTTAGTANAGTGAGGTTSAGAGGTSFGSGGSGGDLCAGVTCSGHGSCTLVGALPSCVCSTGYAQGDGDPTSCVDVDECASNHGGCDPRTSCTNLPGSRACGACPAGYGGTGDSVCSPTACAAAPDASCACIKVSLTGDDTLAAESGGLLPFASIGAALEFASSYPNAPHAVCVAEGSSCGTRATYAGPNGADLAMRDGVSVYGNYESTAWSRCGDAGTTLAPASANGVYFGPTVVSPTVLDGFTIARFSAPSTAGVTLDGAHGAFVSNVDVGTAVSGADTTYGVDAKNGADATLVGIKMRADASWSAPNQLGIRATGAKLLVKNSEITLYSSYAGELLGAWFENADGSALLDSAFVFYGPVRSAGVHAASTSGLAFDGTTLAFSGGADTGAEFTAVSALSWRKGSVSGAQAQMRRAISLTNSPGAALDVAVSIGDSATGIYLTGAAQGTVLDGSVTSTRPSAAGVSIDDCAGTTPLVRTTVNVASGGSGDAISVTGSCSPTISAKANLSVYISGAIYGPPSGQTLSAIHCRAPSQCTIDHSVATITGGATPYLSFIQAYGIACDSGACPTVVDSTASGLSAVGEKRDASYTGGGILAPGATLVARNHASALCSGRDGAGMRASGRIENNVIYGPSCGATFIDPVEKAVGLEVMGPSVVHSNLISGGGATDWSGDRGFNECRAAGVVDGGYDDFLNNIITAGCGPNIALFVPSWTRGKLLHNDLEGVVAYGDASPFNASQALMPQQIIYKMTAVNSLPGASGNFSGGSVVDAGTTLEAPLTDIDGVPRDASPDVGPWEATGTPTACLGVGCSNHGVCRADQGAACVCDPGYSGSDCATVEPCTCGDHGVCELGGSASCSCDTGYITTINDPHLCVVDPCYQTCDPLTHCTLTPYGAGTCSPCPQGYSGTGETGCHDIDECAINNGGCDPLTQCTNTPGGRTCSACPPNYVGTGETGCISAAPCEPNPCEGKSTCSPTTTGFTCQCLPGITGEACDHTFTQMSYGVGYICGVRDDGTLRCNYNQNIVPDGTFLSISAGYNYGCAIRTDGTLACFGLDSYGQVSPPAGTFLAVDAGQQYRAHTCAIRTDGTLVCFGYPELDPTPSGTFTAVSAGYDISCAIATDGSLVCFGYEDADGLSHPPSGQFEQVSVSQTFACGIRTDKTVACWGSNYVGESTPPSGTFDSVKCALSSCCGIRTDSSIGCWGEPIPGGPPSGTFEQIGLGWNQLAGPEACALRDDGVMSCWGTNLTPPPSGAP